jgi:transcriptional regulator with XRE-family HTH domain
VLTGAELKAWRTRHRLTQPQAAKQIGVNVSTIKRAEARPHEPLTPALTRKMRAAGAAAERG